MVLHVNTAENVPTNLNLKSLLTACPEKIRTRKKPKQTNPWLGQSMAGLTYKLDSQTLTLQGCSGTDLLV